MKTIKVENDTYKLIEELQTLTGSQFIDTVIHVAVTVAILATKKERRRLK